MRNVPALTWREMNSVFLSPLAYIVLTVFLLFSGFFFFLIIAGDPGHEASMEGVVGITSFLFLVATPFLTMRLLSEEYRSGTIETLMTAPVSDAEVILGKFFGAFIFFLFMLLPTLIYLVILLALGKPDLGPVLTAYTGMVLMGAQFIALGLFCSALTANQIVAGVTALVALLVIWVLGAAGRSMTGALARFFEYVGTLGHIQTFSSGRIAVRDVFYFLSVTIFWLFLSVRALESRRWR